MINIIFENEHVIILNKPAGVLTVPARNRDECNDQVLGILLQQQLGQQIYPVHRLDLPVAGLVMFAKNADAHQQCNHWFEQKQIKKTYRAHTSAQQSEHLPEHLQSMAPITPSKNEWLDWYGYLKKGKKRAFPSPQGKPAHTRVCFLGFSQQQANTLRWDAEPITGRPHQLRADLSLHGFPIHGDALYGSSVTFAKESIALTAYKLNLSAIAPDQRLGLPEQIEMNVPWDN